MNTSKKIQLLIFATLPILFISQDTRALSCARPVLENDFFDSDIVVRARTISKNSFKVLETYKGKAPKTYTWTVNSKLPKSRSFKSGEEWIFFGWKGDSGKAEFATGACSGAAKASPAVLKKIASFKKGNYGCTTEKSEVVSGGYQFKVSSQKFNYKACPRNEITVHKPGKSRLLKSFKGLCHHQVYDWKKNDFYYKSDFQVANGTLYMNLCEGESSRFVSFSPKSGKLITHKKDRSLERSQYVVSKTGEFFVFQNDGGIYTSPSTKSKPRLLKSYEDSRIKRLIGLSQDESELYYPTEELTKEYKSIFKINSLNLKTGKVRETLLPENTAMAETQLIHPKLNRVAFHTREFDKGGEHHKVHVVDLDSGKVTMAVPRYSFSNEILQWKDDGSLEKIKRNK